MLRDYRYVILAAFGWLTLTAASAPNNSTQTNSSQPTENIDRSLSAIANAQTTITNVSEYQAPCGDNEYNNKSDLCAQWYAARAAGEAARWSKWTFWVGLGSLALSVFGLLALLRSLELGREANTLARDEFEAARQDSFASAEGTAKSLEFAERNANAAFAMSRNNRAWICPQSTDYVLPTAINRITEMPEEIIAFRPKYTNFGQTPAIIRRSGVGYKILNPNEFVDPNSITLNYIDNPLVIGPAQPFWTDEIILGSDDRYALLDNAIKVMIVSRVEYNDIYTPDDIPHVSEHCTIALYKGRQENGDSVKFIFEFHVYGAMNTIN